MRGFEARHVFSISLPAITVYTTQADILSGTTSGFPIWLYELSVVRILSHSEQHPLDIPQHYSRVLTADTCIFAISSCQVSINMGILHTQPLLSEVFTYALSPRHLSRVIAVTGGLSGRHRPSPLFDLVGCGICIASMQGIIHVAS